MFPSSHIGLDTHSIVAKDTVDPQKDYIQKGEAYKFQLVGKSVLINPKIRPAKIPPSVSMIESTPRNLMVNIFSFRSTLPALKYLENFWAPNQHWLRKTIKSLIMSDAGVIKDKED